MPLKIMVAGCSKDERASIEERVRASLAERTAAEAWNVSVVKFGAGWSVTLDGPFERTRGLSFMIAGSAGPDALADAVRKAADPPAPAVSSPAPAGPPTASSMAAMSSAVPSPVSSAEPAAPRTSTSMAAARNSGRGPHKCIVCGRQYIVIYDAEPNEPLEDAPVACPHCWQIGMVQVARSVSVGQDYRAEKA